MIFLKKLLIFLAVILILTLTACTQPNNPLFDIENTFNTTLPIKIVTDKEVYSADDTVIRFTITNTGDSEGSIAADSGCFTLQKLVDNEWKRVGTKTEHCWTALALILPPDATEEREIKLNDYFNLPLDKGTYRIAVEYLLSNTFEIN